MAAVRCVNMLCDASACFSMRRHAFLCLLLADHAELSSEPITLHVLSQLVRARLNQPQGRRVIENLDEVAAVLRRRYPTARVQIVSFGKHPDLTMAEQVRRWVSEAHWKVQCCRWASQRDRLAGRRAVLLME